MPSAFLAAGPTVTIATNAASQRIQFDPNQRGTAVRIVNTGAEAVFVAFGDVTVVSALAGGIPIAAGGTEILGYNHQQYIASISVGAGPSNVYFTPGEGI